MPAKSAKQLKFMQAVKHNTNFAKKIGVPQEVGADFVEATPKNKFSKIKKVMGK